MHKPVERPFGRMVGIAVLAVLVALVAAVSAFAVGGSTTTANSPAASPAQTQTVQESTPEQGERPGPGGREDCPEKDGSGQSSAPGTSTDNSEL
ncbi:MAG TPA: hypothetical protein VEX67_12865 [Solirubrobacteraceae bacterium]|nr:hypothetical protein [Solirubrobacteraceae bacterium]